MSKVAQVDLNKLLPQEDNPPDPDSLRELKANLLFRRMVRRLQHRYLELSINRQSNERGAYEFDAGVASGANEMLKRIDLVLSEAARPSATQERSSDDTT